MWRHHASIGPARSHARADDQAAQPSHGHHVQSFSARLARSDPGPGAATHCCHNVATLSGAGHERGRRVPALSGWLEWPGTVSGLPRPPAVHAKRIRAARDTPPAVCGTRAAARAATLQLGLYCVRAGPADRGWWVASPAVPEGVSLLTAVNGHTINGHAAKQFVLLHTGVYY